MTLSVAMKWRMVVSPTRGDAGSSNAGEHIFFKITQINMAQTNRGNTHNLKTNIKMEFLNKYKYPPIIKLEVMRL